MANVIEGLKYSESHEWVKIEGSIALIGVTDFAQKELGDITYVDIAELENITAGEEFGALESVKASSELYCPVSGKLIEVNEALMDSPELINEQPYESWIIKVEMNDASELDSLMDAAAYSEITK